MNLNKSQVGGNMTRDPELSKMPNGKSVVKFSIAVNRKWKGSDGKANEVTDFVNCVAYDFMADNIHRFFEKGKPIYVEGRHQTRKWDDKDGNKRETTELVVSEFQFIGGESKQAPKQAPAGLDKEVEDALDDINPEDIPF
jgi:single-strand DNA-binding protein